MTQVLNMSSTSYIAQNTIVYIASCKKETNIKTISFVTNIAENHVARIIQSLVKFEFLKSIRGPKVGLVLNKLISISIPEIYELIEGKIQIDNCPHVYEKSPFKTCIYIGFSQKMSLEFKYFLKNMTLKQFLKNNIIEIIIKKINKL